MTGIRRLLREPSSSEHPPPSSARPATRLPRRDHPRSRSAATALRPQHRRALLLPTPPLPHGPPLRAPEPQSYRVSPAPVPPEQSQVPVTLHATRTSSTYTEPSSRQAWFAFSSCDKLFSQSSLLQTRNVQAEPLVTAARPCALHVDHREPPCASGPDPTSITHILSKARDARSRPFHSSSGSGSCT